MLLPIAILAALALVPAVKDNLGRGERGFEAILHYRRSQGDYDGWGLHVWGPTAEQVTWEAPLEPSGQDEYGPYWVVKMEPGAQALHYLVHKGEEKDPGPDQTLDFSTVGREIWLIQGSSVQFLDPAAGREALLLARVGDIKNKAQAHWLTADTIAWPIEFGPEAVYRLHFDPAGAIRVTPKGLQGGQEITLEFAATELSPELAARFPHLSTTAMLRLPAQRLREVPQILKGQIAVSVSGPDGTILKATSLQIPGVLDDLYACDEILGLSWQGDQPTLRIWAPTARSVTLHLYPDGSPQSTSTAFSMIWEPALGTWSLRGTPGWKQQFYLYEVEVFVRQEGQVVRNLVTDPYSLSLATNSTRSQIIDLSDPSLQPDGWQGLIKPPLAAPEDIVLYELHLRDFSSVDRSVPAAERGTYLAFTHFDSHGMRHLRRLATAGVTHVHLLPVFDFATINEDKAERVTVDFDQLAGYPPDSEAQQAAVDAIRERDAYNWGYDPLHFTVPEGSYATSPEGGTRILEFRQMVMALNEIGLRVVMDVVYNHTHSSGQSHRSVLDRVVPGYYHRLDAHGDVATSTCCPNTASEHLMMEKLMRDSLLIWATSHKVDGFRFDLMGHHMKSNIENLRATLDRLTIAVDGLDGKSIYLYGEGWDFGEVAGNTRGVNASQQNMGGTGIGTFNDRIRDAVRGGNPFRGAQEQGFITGLYSDPNEADKNTEQTRLAQLLDLSDLIRVALAGNLADYPLVNAAGKRVVGSEIRYNGAPAGYTRDPQENIIYISAHDNETLFDALQFKLPLDTSMEERVRAQNLGLSLVALSQGIPFFHAGSELLRSKSFDRNSYDSGDWFNKIDFTYHSNNWGVGLPPEDNNGGYWPLMRQRLGRPELKPSRAHILATLAHFEEMLHIRRSSPLFRLNTAEAIVQRMAFHNTGPNQIPGLIVMSLSDDEADQLDPSYTLIVVLFNGARTPVSFTMDELVDADLALHPIQAGSSDLMVRTAHFAQATNTFHVPGRTTAVFVGRGVVETSQVSTAGLSPDHKPG